MRRTLVGAGVFVLLFVAQGFLRPKAAVSSAQPVESAITVISGALTPLFVAMTWVEAEAALDDHQLLEALDRLRLLEAADPAGWEASVFRAHLIAHNLAEREGRSARADRIVEAVRILDAAAARTTDPGPEVAKGQLLLEARLWDRDLSARLEPRIGGSPRAVAVGAFREAARRAPASEKIRRLLMEASRLAGIDLLMAGAPIEEVLELLENADAIATGVRDDVLARKLAQGWAGIVRAVVRSDADAIARAHDRFLSVLREWAKVAPASDDFEALLAAEIIRRAAPLSEQRLRAGDPRAALSILELVHTIRNLVAARLDRSRLSSIRDLADRRQLMGLLDEISRQSPDLHSRTSELKAMISAW